MKNNFKLFIPILFLWLTCSNQNKDFKTLISKVPVTNVPIGVENLATLKMFPYDYTDWNKIEMLTDIKVLTDYDKKNVYNLNDYFSFSEISNEIKEDYLYYTLLPENGTMYFTKRLKPIANKEVLIFYTERKSEYTLYESIAVPLWILFVVNDTGKVEKSFLIGGIDEKEGDTTTKILFYIDKNYVLSIKNFTSSTSGADEGGDNEDIPVNELRLLRTKQYKLSDFRK